MGFITIQQLLIAQRCETTLMRHRGQGRIVHTRRELCRVLQYRMSLPERAKLTDDFATQHVEDAAGGPHYNLRECGLQRLYISAHVRPTDTHMTATLQVVTKCQHHPVDLKQNYKCKKERKEKETSPVIHTRDNDSTITSDSTY